MLQSFCGSSSCNSMPCSGCSALHGVNPNFFKKGIVTSLGCCWYSGGPPESQLLEFLQYPMEDGCQGD